MARREGGKGEAKERTKKAARVSTSNRRLKYIVGLIKEWLLLTSCLGNGIYFVVVEADSERGGGDVVHGADKEGARRRQCWERSCQ